jgi:hypothetical protein
LELPSAQEASEQGFTGYTKMLDPMALLIALLADKKGLANF